MPLTGRKMAICAPRDNIPVKPAWSIKGSKFVSFEQLHACHCFFWYFSRDFFCKTSFFVQVRYIHYSAEATLGWSRPLLEFSASVWFNSFGTDLPSRPLEMQETNVWCLKIHSAGKSWFGLRMFFVMVSQDGLIARYKSKKHALVYLWSNSVWVEISQQERMLGGSEGLYQSVSSVQSRPIYNLS